jgi:mono/diheme cytochrome c family protein
VGKDMSKTVGGRSEWCFALVLMLAGGVTAAQGLPGDRARGEALAARWCAECHQIRPGAREPSIVVVPGRDGAAVLDVPAFQAVADDPAATAAALRAFLHTPHANMPDIRLTSTQADDLVAYILSLKRNRRPGA